jgi:putative FmdB family regulatory protein
MPKYCYKCRECGHQFETRHAIRDRLYDCEECGIFEALFRIPQLTLKPIEHVHSKVGDKVKEFIAANRESLKDQTREAKEEHKP